LAYVVATRDQIAGAARFFTHVPAGIAQTLLLPPRTTDELPAFLQAVRSCDPDVILVHEEIGNVGVLQDAQAATAAPWQVVSDRQLQEHVEGPNMLWLRTGRLAHHGVILDRAEPSERAESLVRLVRDGGPHSFVSRLTFGVPSDRYATFLRRRLAGVTYRTPEDVFDLSRQSVLASIFFPPLALTLSKIDAHFERFSSSVEEQVRDFRSDSRHSLYLYLDSGEPSVPVERAGG
jgi:hypothetical protein